jgi:uncharacterized membrane protein YedE/YeeE
MQDASDLRSVRTTLRPTPPATALGEVDVRTVGLGALGAGALAWYAWQRYGLARAGLFGLGLLLGVALFHARFGFVSAWRQLVAVGQGRGLQAHALMIGTASLLFAPILARGEGFGGVATGGYVAPITLGLFAGAALFGVGMQLGGACASGTLYATGSGHVPVFITLGGFIGGSVLGVATVQWWRPGGTLGIVFSEPVSFAARYGWAGGVAVNLTLLAAIALVAELVRRRRVPPPIQPVPSAQGVARVLRGSWPLWVGALVLAGLNALVLLTSGRPWGVTGAFRLWGSKLVAATGLADPASWPGWAGSPALEQSILLDNTSVTNLGIVFGALIAAGLAGTFELHRATPRNVVAAHSAGGIMMGYGASMAFGCNIGAYFSGIASFSLHGWLWGLSALAGTWVGLRLRPLFGLTNPKPSDSVC